MLSKINKIILLCFFVFFQNISYAKNIDSTNFNEKNIYNYFSAQISLNNYKNIESLKFFNSSKFLKESHKPYIKKYLESLVLNGKIKKAIREIETTQNKKFTNFFEADLLLLLESIKNQNYQKSNFYVNKLKDYKNQGTFEFVISSILEEYVYLFNNKKIKSSFEENEFGTLTLINRAFQNCYLGTSNTDLYFKNIINFEEVDYSRYLFFYINYLLKENNLEKVKNLLKDTDPLNSTLLVSQSKSWVNEKNIDNIKKIFSCKNPNDIIGEILFVISNLYSSEDYIYKSNYYFNLSNYFNPRFKYNLSLLAENYYNNEDYEKSEEILKNFSKKENIYYWYRIKKKAEIINKKNNSEKSFKYIEGQFSNIRNPSLKMIYDMANIVKGFKKYNLSIKYYSKVLSELDSKSETYANILYRRGGSYERIGKEKESDEDLLKSLVIKPDDPYVLNYLAYSWLERNYKIDTAIEMLELAYELRKNDPYIIDSIGWAYYLVGDYSKAEKLLKQAVQIMPLDPIVNDHYGDILWQLNRKIQASYFWKNALTLEGIEEEMKEKIYQKLIEGPEKI